MNHTVQKQASNSVLKATIIVLVALGVVLSVLFPLTSIPIGIMLVIGGIFGLRSEAKSEFRSTAIFSIAAGMIILIAVALFALLFLGVNPNPNSDTLGEDIITEITPVVHPSP